MENASKALLIAASVLIAIVLIAFAVTTINSTKGTQDSVKQTMDAAEVATFNNKFLPYVGQRKSPGEVKALINVVIAHNASVKDDSKKVLINSHDNSKGVEPQEEKDIYKMPFYVKDELYNIMVNKGDYDERGLIKNIHVYTTAGLSLLTGK